MGKFALSQETLKHKVTKLKDKMGEFLIVLQSLVKQRENEESLAASMGHHNIISQPQNIVCHSFHHPQGQWYLKSCI